jgi:hypothetical protein
MPSAPRAERRWKRRAYLALATVALTAVIALPVCNAVFDCGCTWPLLGADAHCDIHHPGPPDCPVCAHPPVAAAFSVALLLACGAVVRGADALASRLRKPAVPGA